MRVGMRRRMYVRVCETLVRKRRENENRIHGGRGMRQDDAMIVPVAVSRDVCQSRSVCAGGVVCRHAVIVSRARTPRGGRGVVMSNIYIIYLCVYICI